MVRLKILVPLFSLGCLLFACEAESIDEALEAQNADFSATVTSKSKEDTNLFKEDANQQRTDDDDDPAGIDDGDNTRATDDDDDPAGIDDGDNTRATDDDDDPAGIDVNNN